MKIPKLKFIYIKTFHKNFKKSEFQPANISQKTEISITKNSKMEISKLTSRNYKIRKSKFQNSKVEISTSKHLKKKWNKQKFPLAEIDKIANF